ncbi:MAG: prolyl oligopeptidase family serine peptidase [Eubacteriales bacterium]|nr:prolyl oligopeptidase family serine peptidase [Eubacteriales bacterium]
MKNILTEKIIIEDIPVLILKENTEKKPRGVIFLYHGWSSKKENYHFIGGIYANEGYQVVIPDSVNHGERGILDYEDESVMEENFWKTVINSVKEYFVIKKYLLENKMLLSNNICVTGNSMGGMISSGIFVKDKDILTLAVMNGACDWLDLDEKIKEDKNIDRKKGIDQKILEEYNPSSNIENFFYRPFLLQHGEEDKSVPIRTQEHFYAKILEVYKGKEDRIKFTKIPNLNHHKTTGMIEESIHWFNFFCKSE